MTGRDGYSVVLALAELDPEFESKSVIVATQADGKPIDAGKLRLVVPGDAGRAQRAGPGQDRNALIQGPRTCFADAAWREKRVV